MKKNKNEVKKKEWKIKKWSRIQERCKIKERKKNKWVVEKKFKEKSKTKGEKSEEMEKVWIRFSLKEKRKTHIWRWEKWKPMSMSEMRIG